MTDYKKARDYFKRHPVADYVMDRLIYAVTPLIEEIEDLQNQVDALSKPKAELPDLVISEQMMRDILQRARTPLGDKKLFKIIKKTTGKGKFKEVNAEDYSALLMAIDKAVVKQSKK